MKKILPIIFAFAIIFILISFNRHRNYYSQGNDLGLFDQTSWLYSQSLTPYNTITGRLDYQDRYKPIMLLIGFIYRFFPGPETLLFLQGFSLAFSGLFIYLTARHLKLSYFIATLLSIIYLAFPGITSFIIDDFHEISLFPFFFLGSIYFFLASKRLPFIICFILSLIIRDYLTVFSAVFWFCFLLTYRYRLTKLAITIHAVMLTIMILAIKLTGGINYGAFTEQGDNLFSTLMEFITHPLLLLSQFFFPPPKLATLLTSVGYFLFLPFLSFWAFIPIMFQFAGRFFDSVHPYRWTIQYHYSGELAALLTLATIFKLSSWPKRTQFIAVLLMVISTTLVIKYHHTPLALLIKPEFWQRQAWMVDNDNLLKLIPPNVSVATQNNLAPHLSHRPQIFILPQNPEADFVLLDLHPAQDQYNFNGLDYPGMYQLQSELEDNYRLVKRLGDSYLYQHF